MWKKLKGWKTVLINALIAVGSVIALLDGQNWALIFPPQQAGWITLGISVLNILLRYRTTTPVGAKE